MRNRSILAVLTAATFLTASTGAFAAETVYIAGTGGSNQKTIEEKIIPAFEAKTGAKVVYIPGGSTEHLAKAIAQKGRSDVSLMLIDSGCDASGRPAGYLCGLAEVSDL